ncbi:MAG: transcription antitermination factor NusB [Fervidobacterium sp.]
MINKRRAFREIVMKILFQYDFRPDEFEKIFSDLSRNIKSKSIKTDVNKYVKGIQNHIGEIDEIIKKHLQNWDFGRISPVERSVLRLGTYELIYEPDIPIEVTLDEMIEIAKTYSSEESGKFVNGILDKIAKTHAPKEKFNL